MKKTTLGIMGLFFLMTSSYAKHNCYVMGDVQNQYPNQAVSVKHVIGSIGDAATTVYGGTVVGIIEYKFQRKGGRASSLKISRMEIVTQPSNFECQFNSIEDVYKNEEKKYNIWQGKHYYIKLIK